jgi:parvulin-like peptidyl-prolyl isomerase
MAKAEQIRKALQAGTDIEKVAATHVNFPNVQLVDKKITSLRRDQMSPALSQATFAVKEGVTEPVVTPDTIYVVKVFGHSNPELKDVQQEITATIQQNKLDAEMEEMKKKAGVWIDEEYFTGRSLPKLQPGAPGMAPVPPPKAQ